MANRNVCPACGKRRDEPSLFCSAVHPSEPVREAETMVDTRFGPRTVANVVGWALVVGVVFGMAGGFFSAWLLRMST